MQVIINNETKEIQAATVAALATELGLPERGVALAVENSIVPRTAWGETALSEGSRITIIKAAFGG